MMHSSDEGIELCSIDRFSSIEPNRTFYKKNTNIIKKIVKVRVRFAVTKVPLSSVGFENLITKVNYDSQTKVSLYLTSALNKN